MTIGRSRVTRFVNGITNVADNNILADFGMPDPTKWITYFNDFLTYVAGDWTVTITQAGAGDASAALTDVNGGALLVTTDAADNDNWFAQKVGECFLLSASKKAFFKVRLKVDDATQSDVVVGLQVTDTTPLAVTDGIYFLKADDAKTFDLICRKDATTGSTSAAAIGSMADDTFIEMAWAYDGNGTLYYAIDGVVKGSKSVASYFPDTELTVSFGVQAGSAVVRTLTVDYILAALER